MGNGFPETSVNKIDIKKFDENFSRIDFSAILGKKCEDCEKEECECEEDDFSSEYSLS